MLCEKLKFELLAAREQREQQRVSYSEDVPQTLLQVSLNLPGADKSASAGSALVRWSLRQLHAQLTASELLCQGEDLLGPWALLSTALPAPAAKQAAIEVETQQSAARLLDIDVFSAQGEAISRRELGLPARQCFFCSAPAVDCIRLQRHSYAELKERVDDLFALFRA